jgi:hypothetical protein
MDFQVNVLANRSEGGGDLHFMPHRKSVHWGVRDPDMYELGARHVWQRSLEPGPGTGHVRCRDLTRIKE